MTQRLAGKVALVTGAGSGIGRATSLRLAAEGAAVVATDVVLDSAKEIALEIHRRGSRALALALDVSDEGHWETAMAAALSTFEVVDVLVVNAGLSFAQPVQEMTLEEWRRVMAINLDGGFLAIKHGILAMRRHPERKTRGGSIVLVSSASGIKAAPGASAYAASKAGLIMLAKSAALECARAKDGIRINTVAPAGVRTPMWSSMPFLQELVATQGEENAWAALESQQPLGRYATGEEIAEAILFLSTNDCAAMTGSTLVVDGGYTA